jgi:hypothetical protein
MLSTKAERWSRVYVSYDERNNRSPGFGRRTVECVALAGSKGDREGERAGASGTGWVNVKGYFSPGRGRPRSVSTSPDLSSRVTSRSASTTRLVSSFSSMDMEIEPSCV